jgi:hypothetical protein
VRRVLLAGAALVLVFAACGKDGGNVNGGGHESTPTTKAESGLSVYDGAPPWPLPDDAADRWESVGIEGLKAEGKLVHYHAHLDVFYDGRKVTVPGNIGLDFRKQEISPLHTHSPSGVIHVESESDDSFTLGQFLTEWGVKVTGECVADKCGDEVAVFVNGSIQDESARSLVIKRDTEIALVLGAKPDDIPSGYDCASNPGDACPNVPG